MKVFVVLLIAFVACTQALTPEMKTTMANNKKDCVSSSKVDEANIKKLNAKEEISDEAVKKYLGCMFTKLGVVNDKGELQEAPLRDGILADYSKDEMEKIITECKTTKGATVDETSFLAYQCFMKQTMKPFNME